MRHSSTLALLLLVGTPCVFAASLSFTGTFAQDNDLQTVNLNLPVDMRLEAWTLSYAGGTNLAGAPIAAGGFAPALALFDAAGNLLAVDTLGGTVPTCYGRSIDTSGTGFCLDARLLDSNHPSLDLPAGDYTLVLTQQGNIPLGLTLADGFSNDAANGNDPSFTGTNAGQPGSQFLDPGDFSQRTSAWALDVQTTVLTPEPATGFLAAAAIAALSRLRRTQSTTEKH